MPNASCDGCVARGLAGRSDKMTDARADNDTTDELVDAHDLDIYSRHHACRLERCLGRT